MNRAAFHTTTREKAAFPLPHCDPIPSCVRSAQTFTTLASTCVPVAPRLQNKQENPPLQRAAANRFR
ncbi:hypothetical protein V5799_003647 [Amblyomma americanum]|uniref:Uncharacterized protein n=1 Tax=Amblyomma americanum TaxID=6943 RepID=A0AAQ4D8D9_AMBAM